jgi:mono/diheme cytochrome c family protein
MSGRALSLFLICLAFTACGPVATTDTSGRDTFLRHCASCHGPEGKGDGPLAASLTRPPADLTRIAERSGGRFDERAVMSMIDGRRAVAAHGERDMPVWGAVFEEEGRGEPYPAYQSLLTSRFLVDYLRTLQVGSDGSE